jgi:hypothetical protein
MSWARIAFLIFIFGRYQEDEKTGMRNFALSSGRRSLNEVIHSPKSSTTHSRQLTYGLSIRNWDDSTNGSTYPV